MYKKLSRPLKGADISYAQEDFDFAEAKDYGIRFFIIRAGIGNSTDSLLYSHIAGAKSVGIPFGFYWYSTAMSVKEAKEEAAACLAAIKDYKPEYPVFYDIESQQQIDLLTDRERTDIVKAFCNAVIKGGYPCGVYLNPSWILNYIEKSEIVDKYELWLANWTDSPNKPTGFEFGQTIWQWGLDIIGGIETDGDLCYVDYPSITKEFYDKNKPEPVPEPEPTPKPEPKPVFKVGEMVKVKRGAKTYDGKPLASFVYDNAYTVKQVGIVGKPDYIVIGIAGKVTAAVKADDLIPYKAPAVKIKVGDKVRVKRGARTYDGKSLAGFVYDNIYTVQQVGIVGKPDYIVIGVDGQVTAAVKASDLYKA